MVDENYEAVWTISKTDKKYHPYKALIIKKNKLNVDVIEVIRSKDLQTTYFTGN